MALVDTETTASQCNLDDNLVLTPDAESDSILNPLENQWLAAMISIIRETADGTAMPFQTNFSLIGQKAASLRPPGSRIQLKKLLQSPEAVSAGIRVGVGQHVTCQQEERAVAAEIAIRLPVPLGSQKKEKTTTKKVVETDEGDVEVEVSAQLEGRMEIGHMAAGATLRKKPFTEDPGAMDLHIMGLPPHTLLANRTGLRMLDINGLVISPARKDGSGSSISTIAGSPSSALTRSIVPAFRKPMGSTLATTKASQINLIDNHVLTPDAGESDSNLNPLEQMWLTTIISIVRETADGAAMPLTAIGQKAAPLRPPGSSIKMEKLLQVQFLKSQLTTKFTTYNSCKADF